MNYFETFKLRQRKPDGAGPLASRFLASLSELVGRPEQFRLVQLWRNWSLVMNELSPMCLPLGHRNRRLDVGTEDSMAMQELLYLKEEIRLRANAFMEEDFFTEVKLELVGGREGLAAVSQEGWDGDRKGRHEVPRHAAGVYLADMPEDDPVARCYRAYCGEVPDYRAEGLPGGDTRETSSSSGACNAPEGPGDRAKPELVGGREGLAAARLGELNGGRKGRHEEPRHATGLYLADMPENDPVARCYRAYCGEPSPIRAKNLPGADSRERRTSSGPCDDPDGPDGKENGDRPE